jgi:hypothetical protein
MTPPSAVAGAPVDTVDRRLANTVERLSRQSVVKNFDAYADIPWDDPEFAVDPDDSRWDLTGIDPLGETEWYRSQPAGVRSRISLYRFASAAQLGWQFENVLKRGLLEMAFATDTRNPVFRYAYHEVIEEAHHSLMFHELVNRSGMDIPGMPAYIRMRTRFVVRLGRVFPELFFIFVLAGEDPIDFVQREALRNAPGLPPVMTRIMRHHVIEEARHIGFARMFLLTNVPKLSKRRRVQMSIQAPIVIGMSARLMLEPPRGMQKLFGIPDAVIREAYTDNAAYKARRSQSVRKLRNLCNELGIITPLSRRIWTTMGIWDEPTALEPDTVPTDIDPTNIDPTA